MIRRSGLAALAAAAGIALLWAAAVGASPRQDAAGAATRGGTLRVDYRSDFDFVDPSLAYFSHSWQMLNAVSLRLVGYPDVDGPAGSRLRPEAAATMPRVSRDGRTLTFVVRSGFRFSDGKPVTAANFAYAITRALHPRMQSPARSYLADVQRVRANGRTLTIRLKRAAPDFVARLALPFFGAVPTTLPLDPQGVGAPLVSAGPYYLKEWQPKRSALLVRNPYWKRNAEPWRSLQRPAYVDRIAYTFGFAPDATKLRLDTNETDLGSVPAGAISSLVEQHGINKSRFFVRRQMLVWYLALNTQSDLFRNNASLRRAVNFAIDRPHLVRQHGLLAGARTDQLLPSSMPGFRDWKLYPLDGVTTGSLNVARRLAKGNLRDGKAVLYTFNASHGLTVPQIVQYNLQRIGLEVEVRVLDRVVQEELVGTRGTEFDLAYVAWGADFADPSTFVNTLLDGRTIAAANNKNTSYFDNAAANRRIAAASLLEGDRRYEAYASLERDVLREHAPVAPILSANARVYVSPSVGCFSFAPAYGTTNLVATCKR